MLFALLRFVQTIFFALILGSAALLIAPLSADAATYPTDYDFAYFEDDQEVWLTDGSTITEIELPKNARNIQAAKYKKDGVEYAVIMFVNNKKRRVNLHVYHPDGTWIGKKTPFTWKSGRSVPSAELTKLKKNKFRVRIIRQTKRGVHAKMQLKQFKVKPKQSTKKKVLAKLKYKSTRIEKPARTGNDEADTLALINYYRGISGLLPVKVNSDYSEGCRLHNNYMILNQTITHFEDSSKPGYTEQGAATGPSANVGGGTASLYDNTERWIASVYHRYPILEPYVKEIGFNYTSPVACLYMKTDSDLFFVDYEPIPFPAPDQTDAFTEFIGYENPDPLDGHVSNPDSEYPVGTVVSLQFHSSQDIESMHAEVKDSNGNALYGWKRLPNDSSDPNRSYQRNAVTYILRDQLASGHTYTARFAGVVDGEAYEKEWQFTTR